MSRLMSEYQEELSQKWIDRMTDEEIRRLEWDMAVKGEMNLYNSFRRFTLRQFLDVIISGDIDLINRTEITSCKNTKGLMWSIMDWAYNSNQEAKVTVKWIEFRLDETLAYDPKVAKEWSDNIRWQREERIKAIKESRAVKERWEQAVTWAREHGAKIRRSARGYNKNTVIVRIYEAGLMDEFNKEFPEYKFDKEMVKEAKLYLKEREIWYSEKKNHGRSRR